MTKVRVAVVPSLDVVERAVEDAGGSLSAPEDADALVWTDPRKPEELRALLERTPARWVQLPFAGIERFVAAGVLDERRTWTCTKGVYGPACAELALGLILAGARLLPQHARGRSWMRGDARRSHRRVEGTTAVIVGTGGIGRALVPMLAPLGVRTIGVNRSGTPLPGAHETIRVGSLDEILPDADWVVIAAASTPETRHLVNRKRLARMKRDAWIVNVARGELVDTDALVEALRDGQIGGAALDVTDPEPLPVEHPLWDLPNAIVTSHTANTWEMAIPELAGMVERNVRRFAAGEPLEGLVDVTLGY